MIILMMAVIYDAFADGDVVDDAAAANLAFLELPNASIIHQRPNALSCA